MEKSKASSTNGADIIVCQYVKECKWILSIAMQKIQVQMDQRPQHKTNYTEPHRRKSGSTLEGIGASQTQSQWHRH